VTVAVVTAAAARDLDDDLPPLAAALARGGIPYEVVVWDDPAVAWNRFGLAVVRAVWDDVGRRGEVLAWAEAAAGATARTVASSSTSRIVPVPHTSPAGSRPLRGALTASARWTGR
jgi:hypothetical protein